MASLIFLFLLGAAITAYVLIWRRKGGADIVVPVPQNPRRDLRYGFYGTFAEQIAETKAFINLVWECWWNDRYPTVDCSNGIAHIKDAGCAAVLDVMPFIFLQSGGRDTPCFLTPIAERNLRALFDKMLEAKVLAQVHSIVPIDEPNLPATQACDAIPDAVALIRRVAADYPDLTGVMVGCNYTTVRPMCHLELFDWVGFDAYDEKSGMLAPGGSYERFRATLRPDQKTLLIPGGFKGQDPTPFVNYALGRPEVWAVVPFIWWPPDPNTENLVGIRDLPVKDAYIAAGRTILGVQS